MGEDLYLACLTKKIKITDNQVFQKLYIRHMPILKTFAFGNTYNSETIKDLVYDAFTWLWNHPAKLSFHRRF